jgi:glutamate 5-kinase
MVNNNALTIKSTSDIGSLKNEIGASISLHGTGGMATKILAAEIAQSANIETWIVNGLKENFIMNAVNDTIGFTKITTI